MISFDSVSSSPDSKFAPAVVAAGVFVGRAAAGGAISGAAGWAANRVLNNAFPAKK